MGLGFLLNCGDRPRRLGVQSDDGFFLFGLGLRHLGLHLGQNLFGGAGAGGEGSEPEHPGHGSGQDQKAQDAEADADQPFHDHLNTLPMKPPNAPVSFWVRRMKAISHSSAPAAMSAPNNKKAARPSGVSMVACGWTFSAYWRT